MSKLKSWEVYKITKIVTHLCATWIAKWILYSYPSYSNFDTNAMIFNEIITIYDMHCFKRYLPS